MGLSSILGSIGGALKSIVKPIIENPLTGIAANIAFPGVGGQAYALASGLFAGKAASKGAPMTIPGFSGGGIQFGQPQMTWKTGGLPGLSPFGGLATGTSLVAPGGAEVMINPATGRPYRRRYRRMNYMNIRAARRSIRRIKGARKLLKEIERQMPRRPAPRVARRRVCR